MSPQLPGEHSSERIFELSCRTGEGFAAWCEWLMTAASGL
jgi:hypothetical protein